MESNLYKIQQQNFLTTLEYYNKIKEKAENYYSFMKEYKESTRKYLLTIKKIYKDFSPSLNKNNFHYLNKDNNYEENEADEDLEEDKNIFELDLNNKNKINIIDINNNNSLIKNDIKQNNNIEIDLSPIFTVTNIIFKQLKNQIDGLKLFFKGIDESIISFHNLIEKTKKEIDLLKINYMEIKKNFFENIVSYQKDNEELLADYSKIEDKIAQFCFLKDNEYIYKNNKNILNIDINILENDLNLKIIKLKSKEKEFMKKELEKNNYGKNYFQNSEKIIIGIKNNILLIIENLKIIAQQFLSGLINNYHLNYKDLPLDLKNVQMIKIKSEYEEILNKKLKKINDDIFFEFNERYKPIQYKIKILKNKNLNQNLYDRLVNNGYDIKIEIFKLTEKDIYFIIKKMYNFSLVKKENYDINANDKKMFISKIINLMFNFKNQHNNIQENNPKISEKQLQTLYKYIEEDKNYRICFLEKLGNKRAKGSLKLPINLYDIIIKIFLMISDFLLKERDINILMQVLILSQTFYKLENDKKVYIYHSICKHELYQKQELWNYYYKEIMLIEIQKRELNEKKIGKVVDENEIKERNEEIAFAQLLSLCECMKNFDYKAEEIINLITPIFETYEINKENRDSIIDYISRENN